MRRVGGWMGGGVGGGVNLGSGCLGEWPSSTPAWMAAPSATASAGSTLIRGCTPAHDGQGAAVAGAVRQASHQLAAKHRAAAGRGEGCSNLRR